MHFDIAGTEAEIAELEKLSGAPDFYNDMESAQKVLQKTKQLNDKIERYNALYSQWEDMVTLVALGNEMEDLSVLDEVVAGHDELIKTIEEMRLETLLSEPYDKNNAILTIHPGAGGT